VDEIGSDVLALLVKSKASIIASASNEMPDNVFSDNESIDLNSHDNWRRGVVTATIDQNDLSNSTVTWKVRHGDSFIFPESSDSTNGTPIYSDIYTETNQVLSSPSWKVPYGDDEPTNSPLLFTNVTSKEMSVNDAIVHNMGLDFAGPIPALNIVIDNVGTADLDVAGAYTDTAGLYEPWISTHAKGTSPNLVFNIEQGTVDMGVFPNSKDLEKYEAASSGSYGPPGFNNTNVFIPLPSSLVGIGSSTVGDVVINEKGIYYKRSLDGTTEWVDSGVFNPAPERRLGYVSIKMSSAGLADNHHSIFGHVIPEGGAFFHMLILHDPTQALNILPVLSNTTPNVHNRIVTGAGGIKWLLDWRKDYSGKTTWDSGLISGDFTVRGIVEKNTKIIVKYYEFINLIPITTFESWGYPTISGATSSDVMINVDVDFPPFGFINKLVVDNSKIYRELDILSSAYKSFVDASQKQFKDVLNRILSTESVVSMLEQKVIILDENQQKMTVNINKLVENFDLLSAEVTEFNEDTTSAKLVQAITSVLGVVAGPVGTAIGSILGYADRAVDDNDEVSLKKVGKLALHSLSTVVSKVLDENDGTEDSLINSFTNAGKQLLVNIDFEKFNTGSTTIDNLIRKGVALAKSVDKSKLKALAKEYVHSFSNGNTASSIRTSVLKRLTPVVTNSLENNIRSLGVGGPYEDM
jgi:hypothetical protein